VTDFNALLRLLAENQVEFIMVNGAAATALRLGPVNTLLRP